MRDLRSVARWISLLSFLCLPLSAFGQNQGLVVRDETLGGLRGQVVPSGIDPNGDFANYLVTPDLGQQAGSNLFHSFREFGIGTGEIATFTGPAGIENLITRVTGGSASDIDGTLRSTIDGASLYVLNPAGVAFGPNATLDLLGALRVGATDFLGFEGTDAAFHANESSRTVLTSASPAEFGFLDSGRNLAGTIELGSTDMTSTHDLKFQGRSVAVAEGASIATVATSVQDGGEIRLIALGPLRVDGAISTRPDPTPRGAGNIVLLGGSIEIGGPDTGLATRAVVASALDEFFPGLGAGTISMTAQDSLLVAGGVFTGEGDLTFIGKTVTFTDDAFASTETQHSQAPERGHAGDITLNATNEIFVGGRITSRTEARSKDSGNVMLSAPVIEIDGPGLSPEGFSLGGGSVSTFTFGSSSGNAGDVHLTADQQISIGGFVDSISGVSGAGGGAAGDVILKAPVVLVNEGGVIDTGNEGGAAAGDVHIAATNSITILGRVSSENFERDVPAGNFFFRAPVIEIGPNAVLFTSEVFSGAGPGNIRLEATELISVSGSIQSESQGPFRSTQQTPISIMLLAPVVRVEPGAEITATTGSDFSGGDVEILATREIHIAGVVRTNSAPFVVDISAPPFGNAGRILLRAPVLKITGAGRVEATTTTDGAGGDITADVGTVSLAGSGSIVAQSTAQGLIDIGYPSTPPGPAGSITIGPVDGKFVTRSVSLSGDSSISTFAVEGPTTEPREGNIAINASDLVLLDGGAIQASVGRNLGGSITIGDGDVAVPEAVVLRNGSVILAEATRGSVLDQGGRIDITSDTFFQHPDSTISADAGQGIAGIININAPASIIADSIAPLDAAFLDAAKLMRPSCAARSASREGEGSLSVARRRGLPVTPEQWLLAFDEVATPESIAGDDEALPPVAAAPPAFESIQVAMHSPDVAVRGDALRGLAQDQQRHGLYADSVATLESALALAEESGDAARTASALGNLANAQLALGNEAAAQTLLTRGIGIAQEAERPDLAATLYNNLGNQQAMLARQREAMASYEASAALAREAGDPLREAQALANAARAALEAEETADAVRLLTDAYERAKPLDPSFATASVLIHLARSDAQLAETSNEQRRSSLLRAHGALHRAQAMARELDDDRTLAYALGNLGALYEGERRTDEALYLTRQALRAAERGEAYESLYRWHWQEGRLLWAKGETSEAITSYRRAVALLEEARQESLAQYGSASLHFRRAVAPVYLALVDALLQAATRVESIQAQPLLLEARETTDQLKAAELRDYFRDECVADLEAKTIHPEDLPGRAAVVYPILLEDRTELLVHLPEGLARFTVDVPGDQVRNLALAFRHELATPAGARYRAVGQKLYDWLVGPYADALVDQEVTTLVFIPDVALRTIPMAALHDGAQFLVERYALAVTPGLSLVDPKPLDIGGASLLLAGASDFSDIPNLPEGFERDIADLPMVPRELAAIQDLYGGQVLLDAAFERERLAQEVVAGSPSVVHLASHAVFTGDPETSFLLTHDGPLTLERMSEVVGRTRFRAERPLELLVLSACETAAGDARAGLGLAGVAVRSGARSVVGSLWSIPDQAAYELVVAFYRALGEPGVSRAAALAHAQRQLLADARFDHPYYWSPYLLVSNWL